MNIAIVLDTYNNHSLPVVKAITSTRQGVPTNLHHIPDELLTAAQQQIPVEAQKQLLLWHRQERAIVEYRRQLVDELRTTLYPSYKQIITNFEAAHPELLL